MMMCSTCASLSAGSREPVAASSLRGLSERRRAEAGPDSAYAGSPQHIASDNRGRNGAVTLRNLDHDNSRHHGMVR